VGAVLEKHNHLCAQSFGDALKELYNKMNTHSGREEINNFVGLVK
jgi:hypothetical protein